MGVRFRRRSLRRLPGTKVRKLHAPNEGLDPRNNSEV
uniref:Uncharacterized protein n=1 Tax=Arundo donax TaxID=35708 RepID=A0A0A8ZJL4_ARUDO